MHLHNGTWKDQQDEEATHEAAESAGEAIHGIEHSKMELKKNKKFMVSRNSCHAGQEFKIRIKFSHDYPKSKPKLMVQDDLSEDFCCFRDFNYMDEEEWDYFVGDAIGDPDSDGTASASSQNSFEQYVQE